MPDERGSPVFVTNAVERRLAREDTVYKHLTEEARVMQHVLDIIEPAQDLDEARRIIERAHNDLWRRSRESLAQAVRVEGRRTCGACGALFVRTVGLDHHLRLGVCPKALSRHVRYRHHNEATLNAEAAKDYHDYEHRGPGTIRNHPVDDFSYEDAPGWDGAGASVEAQRG